MAQKKMLYAKEGPKPVGPYSAVIGFGNLFFVSGQIPLDPSTGGMPEGIVAQSHQSLKNLKQQIEAAGCSLQDVLKATVYVTDMGNYGQFNEIYATYFSEPYPARAVVAVKGLPKGALVEVSAIVGKQE